MLLEGMMDLIVIIIIIIIIIIRKNSEKYYHKHYTGLHVKYSLFLSDFNETWIFLTHFQKKMLTCKISLKSQMSHSHQLMHLF